MTGEASRRAYYAAYYRAHREHMIAAAKTVYRRTRQRRISQAKARYAQQRDMIRMQRAVASAAHPERIRASRRRSYLRHRDQLLATHRAWYAKNRALVVAMVRAWQQTHPDRVNENCRRRRALKRGATVERIDYLRILRESDGRCGICQKPLDLFGIHFDHIVPLAKGGAHMASNIQPTHARCNLSKGARVEGVSR